MGYMEKTLQSILAVALQAKNPHQFLCHMDLHFTLLLMAHTGVKK